ncbi:MAG TPA: ABC transporter permease [Candidatus Bathyarchaeia archaeon]|nr:ABC transporter permease [Candidatus Bathyarchaeia archaeon]
MPEDASKRATGYFYYFRTVFALTLTMMLRRKRIALITVIMLLPVFVPLSLAFLSISEFAEDGNKIFVHVVEIIYLKGMVLLLALFYGTMLVGEEVENQTIQYLLTRPIPRNAIILGRFAAYLVLTSLLLNAAVGMVFAACTSIGGFELGPETFKLFIHYALLNVAALAAYGAFTSFLGAVTRWPIIIGVAALFGWQRFVSFIPGAIDFLTIEKYINALLPALATQRQNVVIKLAIAEFQKQQLLVGATKGGIVLVCIIAAFLSLSCLVIRYREYSQAKALG